MFHCLPGYITSDATFGRISKAYVNIIEHIYILLVYADIPDDQPENKFHPDLIVLDGPMQIALQRLTKMDSITIPSELHYI